MGETSLESLLSSPRSDLRAKAGTAEKTAVLYQGDQGPTSRESGAHDLPTERDL